LKQSISAADEGEPGAREKSNMIRIDRRTGVGISFVFIEHFSSL
jgi:hypothetical protein